MKQKNKNILFLTLKKEYFELIKRGVKKHEFREYKPYWIKRLMNPDKNFKSYDYILFQNGYQSNAPQMLVEFKGIKIAKEKVNWFHTKKYFEIELGEIINVSIIKNNPDELKDHK